MPLRRLLGRFSIRDGQAGGDAKVATDGTSNRLYVDAKVSNPGDIGGGGPSDTPGCPVFSDKLRYILDLTNVVLTASYQTIYSYSGSGKFVGFKADFESNLSTVKVSVDSNVIFEGLLKDLQDVTGNKEFQIAGLFTNADGKLFVFDPSCPVAYDTEIKVEAKMSTGKKLFRYMVSLTKET